MASRMVVEIGGRRFDLLNPDEPKPWDYFQEWDRSRVWYERFLIYRDLGAERSIRKAVEQWNRLHSQRVTVNTTWNVQKARAYWDDRAIAWDNYINYQTEQELVKTLVERRRQLVESDWATGDELRLIAQQALKSLRIMMPGGVRQLPDGRLVEVVRPNVTLSQIAQAMDLASRLQHNSLAVVSLEQQEEPEATWEQLVAQYELERLRAELVKAHRTVDMLKQTLAEHGIALPSFDGPEAALLPPDEEKEADDEQDERSDVAGWPG